MSFCNEVELRLYYSRATKYKHDDSHHSRTCAQNPKFLCVQKKEDTCTNTHGVPITSLWNSLAVKKNVLSDKKLAVIDTFLII
jgi:hypothetical protein